MGFWYCLLIHFKGIVLCPIYLQQILGFVIKCAKCIGGLLRSDPRRWAGWELAGLLQIL